MNKFRLAIVVALAVVFASGAALGAARQPVVVVFTIEAKRVELSAELLEALSDHLTTRLSEAGVFQIVPRSELKKRLGKQKRASHGALYDEATKIDIGNELAAQKSLSTLINKIGGKCSALATLYDLKKSVTDIAVSVRGECDEESLVQLMDRVVEKIKEQTEQKYARKPGEVDAAQAAKSEMVAVPAGAFKMGCNEAVDNRCTKDEKPYHDVHLDAFRIDKYEVTVAQYKACVAADVCSAPQTGAGCNWDRSGRENHPVNCVDWDMANSFCEWAGKRLPTEAEWEKAARGKDGRKYPWGNQEAGCRYAVMSSMGKDGCGKDRTWPVCSKKAGNSPYGACDMAGNVWEWVADWYRWDYYSKSPAKNPTGPSGGARHVQHGGAWLKSKPKDLRVSNRNELQPAMWGSVIGFRCAAGASE